MVVVDDRPREIDLDPPADELPERDYEARPRERARIVLAAG